MTNKKTTTLRRSVLTGGLTLGAATAVPSTFYSNHAWSQNTMHDGGALDAAAETSENNAAISAAEAPLYNVQSVDSVAAVTTDTVLTYTAGQSGTVAAGDHIKTRKDGFTYRVAASGASDEHLTTAGGVKLYAQPDAGGYNIKAFGAVGDGVTDERTAIQKALNTGLSVKIPDGDFLFNSTISFTADNQTIHGNGPSSVLSSGPASVYINSAGFDHCGIQNIKLDGTGTNGGIRIELGSVDFKVHNNLFLGGSQRVWLYACDSVSVTNNTFDSCGYQVIQQNGYVSSNVKVVANTSLSCTGDFVLMNCEQGGPSKNWTIANNTVLNVGGTFDAAVSTEDRFVGATYVDGLTITGNVVDGVAGDSAIHLESPGKTHIANNIFRNCRAPAGAGRFIYVLAQVETSGWYGAAADITVMGNDFIVDTNVASSSGDYIGITAVQQSGRAVINGNNFIYYGSAYPGDPVTPLGNGINISNYSGKADIRDNQFRNLANGAVVNNNGNKPVHFVGNLFQKCTTGIKDNGAGYIGVIEQNQFTDCGQSFVFTNAPINCKNNVFYNTVATGFAGFILGTVEGNEFSGTTTHDCYVETEVERLLAVATPVAVATLLNGQKGVLTCYSRGSSSSSISAQGFQILNRAGTFLQQTLGAALTSGTSVGTFTLTESGGQLFLQVNGSRATYEVNAVFSNR